MQSKQLSKEYSNWMRSFNQIVQYQSAVSYEAEYMSLAAQQFQSDSRQVRNPNFTDFMYDDPNVTFLKSLIEASDDMLESFTIGYVNYRDVIKIIEILQAYKDNNKNITIEITNKSAENNSCPPLKIYVGNAQKCKINTPDGYMDLSNDYISIDVAIIVLKTRLGTDAAAEAGENAINSSSTARSNTQGFNNVTSGNNSNVAGTAGLGADQESNKILKNN